MTRCKRKKCCAPASLIVPRSYKKKRYAPFADARAKFACGLSFMAASVGRGLVPQGPGILNLSLAYPVNATMGAHAESVYLHLCQLIADALKSLGVLAHWQVVEVSFCDGRFNLAWGPGDLRTRVRDALIKQVKDAPLSQP